MNTKRNSVIELLRVMAMFMIVFYHIYCHSVVQQFTDGYHFEFNNPCFNVKFLILGYIAPLGKIGNVIFILITGYYMADKDSFSLYNVAKKLLFQWGFATIGLVVGSTLLFTMLNKRFTGISYYLGDVSMFNEASWFIGYYFIVLVIAKLFLNKYLRQLSREQYCEFVIAIFATTQFSWVIDNLWSIASGLATLSTGIFLYSLGGLIKRYSPFRKLKSFCFILTIFFSCIMIAFSNYNSIITEIIRLKEDSFFSPNIVQYTDNSIIPILIGVSLFSLFERVKPRFSSTVNFVSAATLMVYLVHDNDVFYSLIRVTNWVSLLNDSVIRFILVQIVWTLVLFATGTIAYMIYFLIKVLIHKKKKIVVV